MKNLIIIVLLIAGMVGAQAQKSRVVTAYNYSKPGNQQLDKAMEEINKATTHEKTAQWSKTWYYRGMIYQQIFESEKEEYKALDENPLHVAIESYKKAVEYDEKGRYKDEVVNLFNVAMTQSLNKGIREIKAEKWEKAYYSFLDIIEAGKLDYTQKAIDVDSGVFYFAALSADQAGMIDEAINMYKKSIELKIETGRSYLLMANKFRDGLKDTAKFVETLKDGLENAKDNYDIMLTLIDYYVKTGKLEEALAYINKAIEKDNTNAILFFAQGNILSELGKTDEALNAYNKAIEIDPNNVDVMFNLGTMFFNKGAELNNDANSFGLDEQDKYDAKRAEASVEFEKAATYFEKAMGLAPNDRGIVETLKKIYMQLRTVKDEAKRTEYEKRLGEINEKLKSM